MLLPKTRREGEIWHVCDDLWASGFTFSKLTGDVITGRLLELGYKKGSPNQIYQYRKTWANSRGIQEVNLEANPSVLSDPISRAVALVREEIQAEAEETIARINEEAQSVTHELNQKYEQLQKDYTLLTEQQEKQLQALNQAKTESFVLKGELIQEQQQKAVIEERAKNAEQQLQLVREDTQKRIDEQKQTYEQILINVRDEITAQEKYYKMEIESLKISLENQRHYFIADKDNQRVALQKLEKHVEKAVAAEQSAQKLADEFKRQVKRSETELTVYKNDYKVLTQELLEKSKAIAEVQGELKQLQVIAEERKHQVEEYQIALLQSKQCIGQQEEALKQLKMILEKQQQFYLNEQQQ